MHQDGVGPYARLPKHIVDEVRDNIQVVIPVGMRRMRNVWQEGQSKGRLDFVIVDEYLPGDYLPEGCTEADGEFTFDSVGPGFAEATASLSMSLTVAPDQPRSRAGITFLTAAISKQNQMATANVNGTVIPMQLSLSVGKFHRARQTRGRMAWHMTKCINDMLNATNMWHPVVEGNYETWRASVEHLWGNRGLSVNGSALRSNKNDAVVIDLCLQGATGITIGDTPSPRVYVESPAQFIFTCPEVPANGGWLGYDLKLRLLSKYDQTWHSKAVSYQPSTGSGLDGLQAYSESIPIGGPSFSELDQDSNKHVVEQHGLPHVYVLLQFRGLRYKHLPAVPEVVSVGGQPAILVTQEIEHPSHAFDVLTCPTWFVRGYRIYRINGYVASMKATESADSCAAPNADKQNY